MSSSEYRKKFHAADFWGPKEFYEPQLRFFTEGAQRHQRLIRGGNQVGKSFCCAFELALHLTGAYPRWWNGRRFTKPIRAWCVGVTGQLVRDGPQRQLTARQGEFGTGTIPLSAFALRPTMVPGGTGSIDTLSIAHETDGTRDGISTLTFKSFEQGAEKLQSESIDAVWIDERCSEDIYSELIARTTATDGIVFLSYTPLKGGGQLTFKFLNEYSSDRADIRITVDDAKHISAERREQLAESYQEHEREARIHGIPQLGIARVFPFPIESLMQQIVPETDIRSYARYICGLDFGYGHPAASALCAWLPDTGEFYVVDGFKIERSDAFTHVRRIAGMCRGLRIPIAWPSDGMQHEKSSGEPLADVYRRVGAPMLDMHAVNYGGKSNAVEPAIAEMCQHMKDGKFKIASHMSELAEEILSYHRDEEYRVVKLRDDLICAIRYAFMMRWNGRMLEGCEAYGRTAGFDFGNRYDPRPPPRRPQQSQLAKGIDFDVFS